MDNRTANGRYHWAMIGLHWLMLVLIGLTYACMEFRGYFPRGSDGRALLKTLHFSVGLSVLVLVCVRIATRFTTTTPLIVPPLPPYLRLATWGMHLALYGLLIAMPLLGWAMLSAQGNVIPFFGINLFPLVGEDHALGDQLKDLHETIGNAGYFLIGAHALAALFHHFVRRDNTLVRMLPTAVNAWLPR